MKIKEDALEFVCDKMDSDRHKDNVKFWHRLLLMKWQLLRKERIIILAHGLARGMSWNSAFVTAREFDVHEFMRARPIYRYFLLQEPRDEDMFYKYLIYCMIGNIFISGFDEMKYKDWIAWNDLADFFELDEEVMATQATRESQIARSEMVPDEIMDYAAENVNQEVMYFIPRETNDVYYDSRNADDSDNNDPVCDGMVDALLNGTGGCDVPYTTGDGNEFR